METIDVFVIVADGKTEQVFKPYGDSYEHANGTMELESIEYFSGGESRYWAWVGRMSESAAVTNWRTRGLRVRVRNIQVEGRRYRRGSSRRSSHPTEGSAPTRLGRRDLHQSRERNSQRAAGRLRGERCVAGHPVGSDHDRLRALGIGGIYGLATGTARRRKGRQRHRRSGEARQQPRRKH